MVPDIDRYFNLIASTPLRSRATLGGNIVNASPIGDLTILFLALNSKISLFNGKNRREIQLKDFFKGYKELDKREDEIIEYLRFPCTGDHTYFNFEKVSKRKHLDIASVNSALLVKLEDDFIKEIHISAGGVSPIPLYLSEMANFLYGRELTDRNILDSIEVAEKEISPISDVRGSEAYKRLLMRQLLLTHFITLFPKKISWNHIHEKR
jgi:xanthine dehydrogenase small subunit